MPERIPMPRKLSAKDKAFEKERARFRSRERALEAEVKEKERLVQSLTEQLAHKDTELAEKEDWISRLLEYMDLPETERAQAVRRDGNAAPGAPSIGNVPDYREICYEEILKVMRMVL